MALNIEKLENVQRLANGAIKAACPACRQQGTDSKGNHLYINSDGSYGCAANKEDKNHTGLIYSLVGTESTGEVSFEKEYSFQKPDIEIEVFFKEEDLLRLNPDRTYWNKRGVSSEVLEIFKGGVSTRDKMNNRYCFPIYNLDGQIHGMTGRWILDLPTDLPWKHLGKTSAWIYPYFLNKDDIKKAEFVILVESIGDMLALWQAGIKNVLVIFGASISQRMMAFLIGLNLKKIYISTNNDEKHTVGQDAAKKIYEKLSPFLDEGILEIKLPPIKDFGKMNVEQITKWREEIVC